MLTGNSYVPRYPWDDPAERANLAYAELRRASAVERQCFTSFKDAQSAQERQERAQLLTESQRVCQAASREYLSALAALVAVLRDRGACHMVRG
jgi:hypothetical protein